MEITWIKQPTNTSCGQTAVAMALGVPVEKVIEAVGHATYTRSADRMGAVEKLGGTVGPLTRFDGMEKLPAMALLTVVIRRRKAGGGYQRAIRKAGHCVLWADGKFYDPSAGVSEDLKVPGGFILAFQEVKKG